MRSSIRVSPSLALVLLLSAICSAKMETHGTIKKAVVDSSALRAGHKATAAVVMTVKDGFHAQSHTPRSKDDVKFEATIDANPQLVIGGPEFPAGKTETYKAGTFNVYTDEVVIRFPIEVKADAKPGPIEITGRLSFQACDNNACYQPEDVDFKITTEIVAADADVKPVEPGLFKPQPPAASAPPSGDVTVAASPSTIAVQFLTAFLAGIIFNVMPCVLPVLPLKAIGFYEVSQHDRRKSVALGAVFSLGLIATFAVFGLLIFVSKSGTHSFDWGQLFTKAWFTAFIVIVLLLLAISTFGWFTVRIPTSLYNVSPRHDTYLGNFQFGILTALLSTPCTFGMFVALLAWALTQPAFIGVSMLITVGVGMASPYFLLSAMPEVARRFPRTGPWAELVKQAMAFLLLVSAVYFARPFIGKVLHGESFWWAPFAVIVLACVYLVGKSFQFSRSAMPRVVAVVLGLVVAGGSFAAVHRLTYKPFEWEPYSQAQVQKLTDSGKIVLVDFTADWCGTCQYLEATVLLSNTAVKTINTHHVVMMRADVTHAGAPARELLHQLNPAGSIPLTVIYAPSTPNPIRLPAGIYTEQDLKQAIEKAAAVRKSEVVVGM